MTFRSRISLVLGLVGVAPVILLGLLTHRVNRDELLLQVGGAQARTAEELAGETERFVASALRHLELSAGYIPFDRLAARELGPVLAIPYRQLPEIAVLALLDEHGTAVAPPVYRAPGDADPALAAREEVGPSELSFFSRHVPFAAAMESRMAVGPPYRPPGRAPRVALALRLGGPGARVLAAEVSLAEVADRLDDIAAGGDAAFLVDGRGEPLADAPLSAEERRLVADAAGSVSPVVRTVRRADGIGWLAAYAPVPNLGWGVMLARPGAAAFRAAERVRLYTFFWAGVALVLALALGAFLASGLSRPVARLSAAAQALTEGRYDQALPGGGTDELGSFARAFGHMAREIRRRDEEIRGWNAELQDRVEKKSAELRAAQDQISRARRLAALGSMGAGVAHELNNPLSAIVGLVTLARRNLGADSGDGKILGTALEQAQRASRIVDDLRRLAEREREQAGTRFPLARSVKSALDGVRGELDAQRIAVRAEIAEDVPPVQGHPDQVEEVVANLLRNAIAAMPSGGELGVSLSAVEGDALKLSVSDTGRGIPSAMRERIFDPFFTTKQGGGVGLGLSVSHAIVEAHHGRILVESEEGKGSRFTVLLPAAAAQAHLA